MIDFNSRRDGSNREELAWRISKLVPLDGDAEPAEGLQLFRTSRPTDRIHGVTQPSLCVIAQGAKIVQLGERAYRYDPSRYLLATVELPVTGAIIEASEAEPYLSLKLELEPALIGSVMVESGIASPTDDIGAKGVVVSALESELLDATVRLLRLVDSPAEAPTLLPLLKREIAYRLLIGEQGARLRHLPTLGGHSHRIAQAIERLRRSFDQPMRIESLAKDLGMSLSVFHHHFKAVTDMSPLQYQKQLRLQEARRLLMNEDLDAASAGFQVGYEDASHFSRDYKRHFGHPPMRDVERMRSMVAVD